MKLINRAYEARQCRLKACKAAKAESLKTDVLRQKAETRHGMMSSVEKRAFLKKEQEIRLHP